MSEIYIRSMVELDLPKVSALADEHYPPELYESLEALEQKFLAYSPGCYVAVDGQTIIGYIFSHPWDTRPVKLNYVDGFTIPLEPICYYVHDMLIAPAYRKRSLGRAMAEIVLAHATLDGFSRIDLVAIDDNSKRFWQRLGFKQIGGSQYGVLMSRGFGPRQVRGASWIEMVNQPSLN